MKKYFFFDIDGTLSDKKTGKIIESARATIEKLKAQGHFVCIATGRAYYKTIEFAKEAGIHHIVSNGGAAITIQDQVVINRPIEHAKAVALCESAERLGYGILIARDDSIDVVMKNNLFIQQVGYRQEPTRYFLDQNLEYKDIKDIYKVYVSIPKEKEHQLVEKDDIGYIRFVDGYITCQHDEKEKGIMKMMEIIQGDLKDVVVFGDDDNDMVMFRPEWFSIAMGNACEPLKQKANFVTKANTEDGIAYACEYFGWV